MLRSWTTALFVAAALALTPTNAAAVTACSNFSTRFGKNLDGVCVCTEASCDSVSNGYLSLTKGQVGVYTTSKAGDRLTYTTKTVDATRPGTVDLVVDPTLAYQKMIGFGGAFTDAAAINIYKLTPKLQQKVLDAYYSVDGIQYSVGRIPIASTDFSETIYSYNDVVDDFEMKHFSIDVDRAPNSNKLNLIHRALNMTSRDLSLFASSWAPPVWMTRENVTTNCRLKGEPGDKYWKALALYYTKAIEAYEADGIKMWGLTVQNEPGEPIIHFNAWQSLRLTPELERDFIKLDLGPMIKSKFPDLKLIAHDDNKADLPDRDKVYQDAEVMKYIDGVGIHWYKNLDFFFFDSGGDFDKVLNFHNKYPNLFLLATEACEGYLPSWLGTGVGVKIQEPEQIWWRAENYARDMIEDINMFTAGWTDWNIALDTKGGPNWANNVVDAPIIVDEVSGTEFYKQPMYYYMGHLSKFVPAGSVRVELKATSNKNLGKIHRTAFLTPEKRLVVILCNRNNDATSFVIQSPTSQTVTVTLPGRGMQTIIFPASA